MSWLQQNNYFWQISSNILRWGCSSTGSINSKRAAVFTPRDTRQTTQRPLAARIRAPARAPTISTASVCCSLAVLSRLNRFFTAAVRISRVSWKIKKNNQNRRSQRWSNKQQYRPHARVCVSGLCSVRVKPFRRQPRLGCLTFAPASSFIRTYGTIPLILDRKCRYKSTILRYRVLYNNMHDSLSYSDSIIILTAYFCEGWTNLATFTFEPSVFIADTVNTNRCLTATAAHSHPPAHSVPSAGDIWFELYYTGQKGKINTHQIILSSSGVASKIKYCFKINELWKKWLKQQYCM